MDEDVVGAVRVTGHEVVGEAREGHEAPVGRNGDPEALPVRLRAGRIHARAGGRLLGPGLLRPAEEDEAVRHREAAAAHHRGRIDGQVHPRRHLRRAEAEHPEDGVEDVAIAVRVAGVLQGLSLEEGHDVALGGDRGKAEGGLADADRGAAIRRASDPARRLATADRVEDV